MQRVIVIVAVVAIIVLAGLFILRTRGNTDNLTVFRDEGTVQYKSSSGEFVTVTTDEIDVPNHTIVKTGEDGLAHVVLPDDSMMSLSVNTELKIDFDESKTDVFQSLGKAWFRVQKLAGKQEFTVQTPTVVAAVRGTTFGVERGEEEVSYVTKGSIEIAQLVAENGQKVKKNARSLAQNRLASIKEGGRGETEEVDIPEEKKQTPWFRLNQLINDEFEKGKPRDFMRRLRDRDDFKSLRDEFRRSRRTLGTGTGLFDDIAGWDWSQNGSQLCEIINSSEYQEAINQIKASGGLLGDFGDWLVNAAGKIIDACSDNVITPEESVVLQELYKNQPAVNFAPQNVTP